MIVEDVSVGMVSVTIPSTIQLRSPNLSLPGGSPARRCRRRLRGRTACGRNRRRRATAGGSP
jgi:hypothetical protein